MCILCILCIPHVHIACACCAYLGNDEQPRRGGGARDGHRVGPGGANEAGHWRGRERHVLQVEEGAVDVAAALACGACGCSLE